MFDRILVVCMGNICRSPMAEGVLQRLCPDKQIHSAGLIVERSRLERHGADKLACELAADFGIDLRAHSAKQLTPTMCSQADLILVMERHHLNLLSHIDVTATGKAMLMGKWIGEQEVPDPYRKSKAAFTHVFKTLEGAAQTWQQRLH